MQQNDGLVIERTMFMDIPVRILQTHGTRLMPVNDIADGIGYDHSTMRKLLESHSDILEKYEEQISVPSASGSQKTRCLSPFGVIGLLFAVQHKRVKDVAKRERIREFKEFAIQTVCSTMAMIQGQQQTPAALPGAPDTTALVTVPAPGLVPSPAEQYMKPWTDTAAEHVKFAKLLSEEYHVPEGTALNIALEQISILTGVNVRGYRKLIPPHPESGNPAYLTPTMIGKTINRTGKEVNTYLARYGFQEFVAGEWVLTPKGLQHAQLFPYHDDNNGHDGFQIKWKRTIFDASGILKGRPPAEEPAVSTPQGETGKASA